MGTAFYSYFCLFRTFPFIPEKKSSPFLSLSLSIYIHIKKKSLLIFGVNLLKPLLLKHNLCPYSGAAISILQMEHNRGCSQWDPERSGTRFPAAGHGAEAVPVLHPTCTAAMGAALNSDQRGIQNHSRSGAWTGAAEGTKQCSLSPECSQNWLEKIKKMQENNAWKTKQQLPIHAGCHKMEKKKKRIPESHRHLQCFHQRSFKQLVLQHWAELGAHCVSPSPALGDCSPQEPIWTSYSCGMLI